MEATERGELDTPRHRVAAAAHYLGRASRTAQELILELNPHYEEHGRLLAMAIRFSNKRVEMLSAISE